MTIDLKIYAAISKTNVAHIRERLPSIFNLTIDSGDGTCLFNRHIEVP